MSILFLILLALLLVVVFELHFVLSRPEKYGIAITLLLGYLSHYFIRWTINILDGKVGPILDRQTRDFKSAKRGIDGEDTVYGWLREFFPEEEILRNITIPTPSKYKFDIDCVIASPRGLILAEVKNFSNPVRFEDDKYFQEKYGRQILFSPDDDPRQEVRNHAYALSMYLASKDIENVRINKVLIFSNGLVSYYGEPGVFIVKDRESLKKFIDGIESDLNYSPDVVKKIKMLLRKTE